MSSALVGKYFLGFHNNAYRSGIVETAVDDDHYLVRFDELVGFDDGSKWLEALAVVAISDMDMTGREFDDQPPWSFFEDIEKRVAKLADRLRGGG